jgi:hypothetical protein
MFSSTENMIGCKVIAFVVFHFVVIFFFVGAKTFVTKILRIEVYIQSQPLMLTFDDDLHMLENSSIVWTKGPLAESSIVFSGNAQLICSRNVTLVRRRRDSSFKVILLPFFP